MGRAVGRERPGEEETGGQVIALPVREAPAAADAADRLHAAADQLWPAWQSLSRWEDTAWESLGETAGELLVLLWSLHRLGGSSAGITLATELLDAAARLQHVIDPVLEDIVECAFALGAAWAEDLARTKALDNPRPGPKQPLEA